MPRSTRLFLFALSCSLFLLMSAGCNKKQGGKKQKNSDEPTIKVESDIKEFKEQKFRNKNMYFLKKYEKFLKIIKSSL